MEPGTEEVILTKKWNKIKAGSPVVVDAVRAAWLREHGFTKTKPAKGGK